MLGELREVYEGFVEEFKDSNKDENYSRSGSNTNIFDSNNYIESSNRSRKNENILRDVSNSVKRDNIKNNKNGM